MRKKNQNKEDKYDFLVNEGINQVNKGFISKAEKFFLKAIVVNNNNYQAYINLSNIYILQKNKKKCINLLLKYISEKKYNTQIVNHAAKIFYNYNYSKELKQLFEILKLNKKIYIKEKQYIYFIQGKYYEKNQQLDKAKIAYSKSIKCDELFFESYTSIINLYEKTNELKKIRLLIEKSFKIFNNENHLNILRLYYSILLYRENNFKESSKIIKKYNLIDKLKNDNLLINKLLDIQSKNYEKLQHFSIAYKIVEQRNNNLLNLKENQKYNNEKISDSIKKYKNFFIKKNIKTITNNLTYSSDENLVFLIGFPRSGTTLLDTILRTHSKIKVLEEKPFILDLRHQYFKRNNNDLSSMLKISQKEKDRIRNDYFNKIFNHSTDKKKIIIDKFPLSIIELGFIKCIFPNSKIILAMRHPCDVITSCFFSSFKINDAMINFLQLEDTINFYNQVFNLFEFYEKEMNLKYFLIKYENIVNDFRENIELLLEFLGLNYEIGLEKFYNTAKNRKKISTPSYNQVINPLYKTSIGRWKNYEKIKKSKKEIGKWIDKFNY